MTAEQSKKGRVPGKEAGRRRQKFDGSGGKATIISSDSPLSKGVRKERKRGDSN